MPPRVFPQRMRGAGRGTFSLIPIVLFALYLGYYWLTHREEVPITGRTQIVDMSHEQEMALGVQAYREILQSERVLPASDPRVQAVRDIGERIARAASEWDPGFEWAFNVIESPDANAFALPGGKVAVYTGILPVVANNDGLAVVMGHEVAHALARHGAERMAQQKLAQMGMLAAGVSVSQMDSGAQQAVMAALGMGVQYGVMLPFSRDHESEADRMGLVLVARACFDPREAPALWERMGENAGPTPPEFASTHPSSETRIEQFKQWMPDALEIRSQYCDQ